MNGFNTILGDAGKETALLQYAQSHQFDRLLLYNLHQILLGDLTNPNTTLTLALFIEKAKTHYGISQIAAVGENAAFLRNKVQIYNNAHAQPTQKFDAYNLEFEFWIDTPISPGGYYCTTYLIPNGYSWIGSAD